MNNDEKRAIAEINVQLMDKMYALIKSYLILAVVLMIINFFTGGYPWSLWVIVPVGGIVAIAWYKKYHTVMENRYGENNSREAKIQHEMNRITVGRLKKRGQ